MGLKVKRKTAPCIVTAKGKPDMPIHTDSTFLAIHSYISIAASTCTPFLAVGRCSQQIFPECHSPTKARSAEVKIILAGQTLF